MEELRRGNKLRRRQALERKFRRQKELEESLGYQ